MLNGLAQTAALIITGVFRYVHEGSECSRSTAEVSADGTTFKDHGKLINDLFIANCALVMVISVMGSIIMVFSGYTSVATTALWFGKFNPGH